jgi:hypothetical protein
VQPLCISLLVEPNAWIGPAASVRATASEPWLGQIQNMPSFDFLHSEPRYQAIVKKMGLPPEQ